MNEELPEGEPNPVFNETGGIHGDEHDGVVELNDTNKTTEVEVVNRPADNESLIEVLVLKYWLGGKPADADRVNFDLYENGICRLGELERVSQAWAAYWGFPIADNMTYYAEDGISKYEDGVPVKHSVKEKNMFNGYKSLVRQPTEQYYNGHKYLEWKAYNIPIKYIMLTKHWNDLDNVDRAGVKLTLYRSVEGESPKAVEGAPVFIPSVDKAENDERQMWRDLPMYSDDLKPYTYFVKEEFIDPNDPNNQNWEIKEKHDVVFIKDNSSFTVHNTAISGGADQGELIVEKKFDNATIVRGVLQSYKFKVVGPDGYEMEFYLQIGGKKVLNGLKYGVYTVTEENLQGFMAEPTFNETGDTEGNAHDGKVRLSSNSKVANVEVINHPKADEVERRALIKKTENLRALIRLNLTVMRIIF